MADSIGAVLENAPEERKGVVSIGEKIFDSIQQVIFPTGSKLNLSVPATCVVRIKQMTEKFVKPGNE